MTAMFAASAQMIDPSKVTCSVKETSATEAELVVTVKLDAGWHMYSQFSDYNGPIPTMFEFEKSNNYALVGKVREPKPHEENDPLFGCVVKSFEGTVVFYQKIKRLSQNDFTVKGMISYQLCNNGSCIAPEDHEISFKVKGTESGTTNVDSNKYQPAEGNANAIITKENDSMIEGSKEVDTDYEYDSEADNSFIAKIILIALIFFILQCGFALLMGNTAVLYKRNGLPLMILCHILIAFAPLLHPILNMIRYDHPFFLPETGWLLFMSLSLLGGLIETFFYYLFLQKKLGGTTIKQTLKSCEWWIFCLVGAAILSAEIIILLIFR